MIIFSRTSAAWQLCSEKDNRYIVIVAQHGIENINNIELKFLSSLFIYKSLINKIIEIG